VIPSFELCHASLSLWYRNRTFSYTVYKHYCL